MNKIEFLNPNYSTTRLCYKLVDNKFLDENGKIKEEYKFKLNFPEFGIIDSKIPAKKDEKFDTFLFLPEGEGRKGEGGLRTKGYFKFSYEKVGSDWYVVDSNSEKISKLELPTTHYPLITIITVVYNGEKYLEETIQSVINQTYPNVEYIIIDGGSTDGTLDIIRKYEDYIDYWVSEKDRGISDAFNKGVIAAKGCYINFQGDGDGFVLPDSLEKVIINIEPNKDVLISARIQRIDIEGKELFTSKHVESFDKKSLLFRMSLPHQGLFTHKNYFKKYGLFDVNNFFCMDYELLLRSYHEFPKVVTKNIVVARWRNDGLGNDRILEIYKEYDKIKRDNKVSSSFVLNCIKYWTLFKYYVKKIIERK